MPKPPSWLHIALLATVSLFGWWFYGLFDLDEGFYAAVTAEMNWRGEWITPYYNGVPWFEKPILLYWLAKPSVALFGDAFGSRLPSVLATLGTMALMGWFLRRRVTSSVGKLTVLTMAGSLLVVAVGKMMLTDPLLLLCLTGASVFFWESLVDAPKWRLISAAFLGFSVLAKGPVGLILFAAVASWTYFRQPSLRPAFKGYWILGTLVVAAITSLWYIPAYLANGDLFVQKFLIEQNLERFTGGDKAHTLDGWKNILFYPAVILAGMFPWSLWLPKAWPRKPNQDSPNAPLKHFLATWAGIVVLFFFVGGAKLPHYLLPAFPPLAALAAMQLIEKKHIFTYARVWVCAIALITFFGFSYYYASFHQEVHSIARYVREEGGANVAVYQMSRRNKELGTGEMKIQETSHPSLIFYLKQTVIDADELQELMEAPKPLWIITRSNRISEEDIERAKRRGLNLQNVPVGESGHYKLYKLDKNNKP